MKFSLYKKLISIILSVSLVGASISSSFGHYFSLAVPGAGEFDTSFVEPDLNDKNGTASISMANLETTKKWKGREGLMHLSKIITEMDDFERKIRESDFPDLKGLRLGVTNNEGTINFSPKANYHFRWHILNSHSAGWEAIVVENGVEDGWFKFKVKLTKKGETSVYKIFQIGKYERRLKGRGKEKDKTYHILDIDNRLGLRGIEVLITKPVNYDWKQAADERKLPDLRGLILGTTDKIGRISFNPCGPLYPFSWNILGSAGKGWEAVITENGVMKGYFEFTVKLSKEGEETRYRIFQIGRYVRELKGVNKEKGKTRKILDINDRLGLMGITEIITKPTDYNWEEADQKGELPDLTGLRIGRIDTQGRISFNPLAHYPFGWNILGVKDDNWEAVIAGSGVRDGYFWFTVKFTKEGKQKYRIFQIGRYTRILYGDKYEKGNIRKVLDIDERLGLRGIAELISKPVDHDWKKAEQEGELSNLKGLRLGITGSGGRIDFSPIENYPFQRSVLGFMDAGWDTVIERSGVRNGYYEITVKLTKKGEYPRYRTFQIGLFTRELIGHNKEEGNILRVLDIGDRFGLRGITELITKPQDYDWKKADERGTLSDLTGLRLGMTDRTGRINFNPIKNHSFQWSALGFMDAGWDAVIEISGLNEGFFQFVVKFTKDGCQSVYRIFQIGPYSRYLCGVGIEKGSKEEVFNILSLAAIQRLAGKEDFKKKFIPAWNRKTEEWVVYTELEADLCEILSARELFKTAVEIAMNMEGEKYEIAQLLIGGSTPDDIIDEGFSEDAIEYVCEKMKDGLSSFYDDVGSEQESVTGFPPLSPVSDVFKYLCDNEVTSFETAIKGEDIAAAMGHEFSMIEPDLDSLTRYIRIIEEVKSEDDGNAMYYVPKGIKKLWTILIDNLPDEKNKKRDVQLFIEKYCGAGNVTNRKLVVRYDLSYSQVVTIGEKKMNTITNSPELKEKVLGILVHYHIFGNLLSKLMEGLGILKVAYPDCASVYTITAGEFAGISRMINNIKYSVRWQRFRWSKEQVISAENVFMSIVAVLVKADAGRTEGFGLGFFNYMAYDSDILSPERIDELNRERNAGFYKFLDEAKKRRGGMEGKYHLFLFGGGYGNEKEKKIVQDSKAAMLKVFASVGVVDYVDFCAKEANQMLRGVIADPETRKVYYHYTKIPLDSGSDVRSEGSDTESGINGGLTDKLQQGYNFQDSIESSQ